MILTSRDQMLGTIRRALRQGRELPEEQQALLRSRLANPPRHLIPTRSLLPTEDRIGLLIRLLEREYATVSRLADLSQVPDAVSDYLATQNLPQQAVLAPHDLLASIPWSARPLLRLRTGLPEPEDLIGIQHAWAAVAETGTLVFPSAPDRPNTLNLLPDTQIVLLPASRVVGPLEDAFALWRAEHGTVMPRTMLLVTGPSRSSDVEQALELGAHGPRRVHVLLLDNL
jgi:L-lactate dehydrogenase complex protein LldG